jgi:hypothetical protein
MPPLREKILTEFDAGGLGFSQTQPILMKGTKTHKDTDNFHPPDN